KFFEVLEALGEHLGVKLIEPLERARFLQVGIPEFADFLREQRDRVRAQSIGGMRRRRRKQGPSTNQSSRDEGTAFRKLHRFTPLFFTRRPDRRQDWLWNPVLKRFSDLPSPRHRLLAATAPVTLQFFDEFALRTVRR